jgi:hypothetical protein
VGNRLHPVTIEETLPLVASDAAAPSPADRMSESPMKLALGVAGIYGAFM